jgi:NADH:ubiquinone oxidoreductase subunit 5 (subunit L)/multisubunit Na+/H+ antiporter MnhA subunit
VEYTLLLVMVLPAVVVPFVYFVGKKSFKGAAFLIVLVCLADIALLLTTVPAILNGVDHRYVESYYWIPVLHASFTLFVDGISFSMAIITLILILAAALFSIDYMHEKKGTCRILRSFNVAFNRACWSFYYVKPNALLFLLGTDASTILLYNR